MRLNEIHTDFIWHTLSNHRKEGQSAVVITHHLPSQRSVDECYKGNILNGAYANDLDYRIEHYMPDVWIHGHTHTSLDYKLGETRVLCNPRGYYPGALNPDFDPELVIEV